MKRELDVVFILPPTFKGGTGAVGGKLAWVVAGVGIAEVTEKGLSTPRFIGMLLAQGADSLEGWGVCFFFLADVDSISSR
jgi:hypothetical protein